MNVIPADGNNGGRNVMSEQKDLNRRDFLRAGGAAGLGALWLANSPLLASDREDRPNILWITAEDMSPTMGCYGDDYAATPHLDRLAEDGVRYTQAFASAPVCSPARSCLISGVYATTLSTQNLRSAFPIPDYMKGFPTFLRRRGYFTSNRTKTDYNTADEPRLIRQSWDRNGKGAHWRNRDADQPFFCVFNHMISHQSRSMVWPYEKFKKQVQSKIPPEHRHDPAEAPIPPYYPDTPLVRRTVARYYDCCTAMDQQAGTLLQQLEEDGLADDTIVFFYGDHGAGLPRHKRDLHDSGMHVPLVIRFPEKYRHLAPAEPGGTVDRLVSFVDFAPTVLSLAGLSAPEYMQGRPFLGEHAGEPRDYIYGARDRVDEAFDMARSVRDDRYLYIRNYMPHLSYHQPSAWPGQGEIRDHITRLAEQGKLNEVQMSYAGPTKPAEELYDTKNDPHQIHNIADSAEHREIKKRLKGEMKRWIRDTRDLGFLPEMEVWERMDDLTPYETARKTDKYPQERILEAAELVGKGEKALPRQKQLIRAKDSAVRYWGAVGLHAQGEDAAHAEKVLMNSLDDPAPAVRIEAATVLTKLGRSKRALKVLEEALKHKHYSVVLKAARKLELLGEKARAAVPAMKKALQRAKKMGGDPGMFIGFALNTALEELGEK
jgi:arylsulfatase A-like enzyme